MKESCLKKQEILWKTISQKIQCGFGKGYSTQQCFIALIEKWKSATDKGNPLELYQQTYLRPLIVSLAVLRLVCGYLSNRKQKTKINESHSFWEESLFGVPQRSILGHLLFNIFVCEIFL